MILILYNGNEERYDTPKAATSRIAYLISEGVSTRTIEVFNAERMHVGVDVENVKLWCDGEQL